MKRLDGFKKIKTAVFISGNGSNLENLIKFSKKKNSPIIIVLIVSNNPKAKGLRFSKKYDIKKMIFKSKFQVKNENNILLYLKKNKIKLICLAGFMKILSKNFIKRFQGNILNIHPSLLPKYKGLNTHARALKNGEKFSGCTVHFVSSKLDSGKIISYRRVKISRNDTPTTLAKKVLKHEHILYPKAIKKLMSNL